MDDAQVRRIRETFEAVADGYDNPALRFFPSSAKHVAAMLELRGDEAVLDVACGTGHASLAIAPLLPRGRVTAIDVSPAMLAHARRKAASLALHNLKLVECDMQAMDWRAEFDVAVCAFGIFFVDDMDAQLARIAGSVKPGGRVVITSFDEDYMMPLRSLMMARLASFGVEGPSSGSVRVASEEACQDLLRRAGLRDIRVEHEELGYPLLDSESWWDVIWNAGFRRLIAGLSPEDRLRFKEEHLAEIEALRTEEGIRMNVGVLFSSGVRPR